ncbi:hypothetical protein ACULPM_06465 [Thermophilibacter sp. ZX-H3]|uniref:hypothetical protein n=1 Tax=unclassified Thermophilibacter TaxID=2847308 RepID=UPI004040AAED
MLQAIILIEIALSAAAMLLMTRHHRNPFRNASIMLLVCIVINVTGNFFVTGPSLGSLVSGTYNGVLMMVGAGSPEFAAGGDGDSLVAAAFLAAFQLAGICALYTTVDLAVSALASRWLERSRVAHKRFSRTFLVSAIPDGAAAARSFVTSIVKARENDLVAIRGFDPDDGYASPPGATMVTSMYDLAAQTSHGERYAVSFMDFGVRVERTLGDRGYADVSIYRYDELAAKDLLYSHVLPAIVDDVQSGELICRASGYRVLLIGAVDGLAGCIARQLAMNLQLPPDGQNRDRELPRIDIWSSERDESEGWFEESYPSLGLAATMTYHQGSARGPELYAYVKEESFDWVILAQPQDEHNVFVARSIMLGLRRTRPERATRVAARCREPWKYEDQATGLLLFGADDSLASCNSLIGSKMDDRAKLVNAFYAGIPAQSAIAGHGVSDAANEAWQTVTTQFDRDSSRAMAGFAEVERAWLDACRDGRCPCPDGPDDYLARLEHHRWVAFHVASGFSPMSLDTMRQRYLCASKACAGGATPPGFEPGKTAPGKYARVDGPGYGDSRYEHVCIAPWSELPRISAEYNKLTGESRDFQQSDRDVIKLLDYLDGTCRDARWE